ncbi:hypothetical protein MBLNU457_7206t1 [Dothideomycetes sp. NU457]
MSLPKVRRAISNTVGRTIARRAVQEHPRLLDLVRVTGRLDSAQSELRWLREHARENNLDLIKLIDQRATGKPLQHILGTAFFGDLEILCEPDVLIPRWETALSVTHLVNRIASKPQKLPPKLNVLDLCTGTGCMSLLFRHVFRQQHGVDETALSITGIDLSQHAVDLAARNLRHQRTTTGISDLDTIDFVRANVLIDQAHYPTAENTFGAPDILSALEHQKGTDAGRDCSILMSNPPYIDPDWFENRLTSSVRDFEPKLALVPPPSAPFIRGQKRIVTADVFYPHLLSVADKVNAKVIMLEVEGTNQARRVAKMVEKRACSPAWTNVEIWKDQPTFAGNAGHALVKDPFVDRTHVRGNGKARTVFACRGVEEEWLNHEH